MKYPKEQFDSLSDEKKFSVIKDEISLATHNGTTKEDMLMLLEYCFSMANPNRFNKAKFKIMGNTVHNPFGVPMDCPTCPACLEPAYDDDYCLFCGQPFIHPCKWHPSNLAECLSDTRFCYPENCEIFAEMENENG